VTVATQDVRFTRHPRWQTRSNNTNKHKIKQFSKPLLKRAGENRSKASPLFGDVLRLTS
jgi:hypothetical protein